MFYTINLSPLLVTKKGFMLIIILSNYQLVSTAFNVGSAYMLKNKVDPFIKWSRAQFHRAAKHKKIA